MNNANHNFTNTVRRRDGERLSTLEDRIKATVSEIDSLGSKADLSIMNSAIGGLERPAESGRRAERMRAAIEGEFYRAAENGDEVAVLAFLAAGFDPNMKRPKWNDTVLQIAATRNARDVVRVLIESGDCDYLVTDQHGYRLSDIAFLFGRNPALARLFEIKERQQAEANGVTLSQ